MAETPSQLAEDIARLTKQLESNEDDSSLRFNLLCQIDALHRSIQKPSYTPYHDWSNLTRIKATSALLQHDIIQKVPEAGFISAKQLANRSTLEEPVIIRLMRHLTSQGIFELGTGQEPTYAHTVLSSHYLRKGGPEYSLLWVKECCMPDIGDYFKDHDASAVQDPARCPGAWADNAEGQDWFAMIAQDKQRLAIFDGAMQFSEDILPFFGMYPFEQLVDSSFPEDKPLIVDVGGGRGQAMVAIKQALPGLQGRLICQDRPWVLDSASQAELGGVEKMEHDFFTPQPVKGMTLRLLILVKL